MTGYIPEDARYDFDGWIKNNYPDKPLTPDVYKILREAYKAGYVTGRKFGYLEGRTVFASDVKIKMHEIITDWKGEDIHE